MGPLVWGRGLALAFCWDLNLGFDIRVWGANLLRCFSQLRPPSRIAKSNTGCRMCKYIRGTPDWETPLGT